MRKGSKISEYRSVEVMQVFCVLCLLLDTAASKTNSEERKTCEKRQFSDEILVQGDVLIGGLTPMHLLQGDRNESSMRSKRTRDSPCREFNIRGLMLAEAMIFVMDKINRNNTLLPGINLGMNIRDSCGSVDYAIQKTLKFRFIRGPFTREDSTKGCSFTDDNSPDQSLKNESKVIAIVGSAISGITMAVASLAGLFKVPVVSYASTSRLLQDRDRFKYFLRTVPSDNLQVKALVDLVYHFHWSYIITIASDNEYGRSGMASFHSLLKAKTNGSVCIAVDALFTVQTPRAEIDNIFTKIKQESSAKTILLFADNENAHYFVSTAKEHNLTGYAWLASDSWCDSHYVTEGQETVLEYMLGTIPEIERDPEFEEYFTNITTDRTARNPVLKKYEATIRESIAKRSLDPSPYITPTVNAMYAVAYGLHKLYNCTRYECPREVVHNADYTQLYHYIKNVTFHSQAGRSVRFDMEHSVYDIVRFEPGRAKQKSRFVKFGQWSTSNGIRLLKKENISIPLSTCGTSCPLGFWVKRRVTKHPKCCWECLPCPGDKFTNATNQERCMECPMGFNVANNRSSCTPRPLTFLLFSNPLARVLLGYSCVGSLTVFITWAIYHAQKTTPIIKASSYKLSCLLLLGILWNFVMPVLYMLPTTQTICIVNRTVASTGLCLFFSSVIIKTNRIARIFSRKAFQTTQMNYLAIKWQVGFILLLCLLNIAIALVGFLIADVKVNIVQYAPDSLTIICEYDNITCGFVLMAYLISLLIICTYQAFLIRKVPENYNEAKFISFTTLAISLSVLVYLPGHQGLKGNHRTLLVCLLYLFCDTVGLVCLFGPKVYIILFRPEKNVASKPRNTSACRTNVNGGETVR